MIGQNKNIWIVDDDQSIRWVLEKTLINEQLQHRSFANAEDALEALDHFKPDVLLCDIRMPGMDGLSFMKHIKQLQPNLPVIIMTAHSDLDSAVKAYEGGAFEYLPKPFDTDQALDLVNRALQLKSSPKKKHKSVNYPDIIGEAPSMQEVFRAIGRLARSNMSVLINGESGTGKELVAKALHQHSPRKEHPFIALNMAAISKDLLESELFGHEKGAFTGAQERRLGRFEQANKGTLFLDEIGDMPADLQTRLLRVLSNGEFYRVGGHTPIKVDVRIIAATHQNLLQQVENLRFREDLYHRLHVIRIYIPPLRQRTQDIPLLANYFMNKIANELSVKMKTLNNDSIEFLMKQAWPGNVRQLENTCRWLTVMSPADIVSLDDMPEELTQEGQINNNWQPAFTSFIELQLKQHEQGVADIVIDDCESILIKTVLKYAHGRKREAAKVLGWSPNKLYRRLEELELEK